MTTFGLDYSGSPPIISCMKEKKVDFVARYLEPASDWKTLTAKEADALRAAGIGIVGLYETSPDSALGGFPRGVVHAKGVLENILTIGMPKNRPVYFAVDFDARGDVLTGPVRQYFLGLASVLPVSMIGVYAGYIPVKYLFDNGLVSWAQQTYAWSRPVIGHKSDGSPIFGPVQWDPRAQIQQYNNGEPYCSGLVDFNRGMYDDIGQWQLKVPGPVPIPRPDIVKEGDVEMRAVLKYGGTPTSGWTGFYSSDGVNRLGCTGMNHAGLIVALGAIDARTHKPVTQENWSDVTWTNKPEELDEWLTPGKD